MLCRQVLTGEVKQSHCVGHSIYTSCRTKKGNRPSFIRAARPETAIPLYEQFVRELELLTGKKVGTGRFGADMKVALLNDGPVTIIIDSKNKE